MLCVASAFFRPLILTLSLSVYLSQCKSLYTTVYKTGIEPFVVLTISMSDFCLYLSVKEPNLCPLLLTEIDSFVVLVGVLDGQAPAVYLKSSLFFSLFLSVYLS